MSENDLAVIGLLLTVAGPLLALYTGNIFGFSEGVRRDIEIAEKSPDKKSRDKLLYYKLNECVRKIWPLVTVAGVVILIISFL